MDPRIPESDPQSDRVRTQTQHGRHEAVRSDGIPFSRVGKFKVRAELGRGAWGVVYLAYHPDLDCDVAIKVPRSDSRSPAFMERFLLEGRAAAKIRHQDVCRVLDVCTDNDTPYIVMEYFAGPTLAKVIADRSRPFPERTACKIIRQLALAVDAAHSAGVVHRDLKPSNVLVSPDFKRLVITDFGIARLLDPDERSFTKTGDALGTPAYMAPEQSSSSFGNVGTRSDVYALGVTFFEMLTKRLPFEGANALEIQINKITLPPPRPSLVVPEIDARIDDVCQRAMATHQTDRFSSAKAMADELLAILGSPRPRVVQYDPSHFEHVVRPGAGSLPISPDARRSEGTDNLPFELDEMIRPQPRNLVGLNVDNVRFERRRFRRSKHGWQESFLRVLRKATMLLGAVVGVLALTSLTFGVSSIVAMLKAPRPGGPNASEWIHNFVALSLGIVLSLMCWQLIRLVGRGRHGWQVAVGSFAIMGLFILFLTGLGVSQFNQLIRKVISWLV